MDFCQELVDFGRGPIMDYAGEGVAIGGREFVVEEVAGYRVYAVVCKFRCERDDLREVENGGLGVGVLIEEGEREVARTAAEIDEVIHFG